jgi:hypothetical protein
MHPHVSFHQNSHPAKYSMRSSHHKSPAIARIRMHVPFVRETDHETDTCYQFPTKIYRNKTTSGKNMVLSVIFEEEKSRGGPVVWARKCGAGYGLGLMEGLEHKTLLHSAFAIVFLPSGSVRSERASRSHTSSLRSGSCSRLPFTHLFPTQIFTSAAFLSCSFGFSRTGSGALILASASAGRRYKKRGWKLLPWRFSTASRHALRVSSLTRCSGCGISSITLRGRAGPLFL